MPSDAPDRQPGNSQQQKPRGELSTWLVTVLVHALPCFVLGLYIAICVCAVCGLWRVC